jgi:hypothetical protein
LYAIQACHSWTDVFSACLTYQIEGFIDCFLQCHDQSDVFFLLIFFYQLWLLLGRKWIGTASAYGAQCCIHLEKMWQVLVYIYCSDTLSRSGTACSPVT